MSGLPNGKQCIFFLERKYCIFFSIKPFLLKSENSKAIFMPRMAIQDYKVGIKKQLHICGFRLREDFPTTIKRLMRGAIISIENSSSNDCHEKYHDSGSSLVKESSI